MGFYLNKPNREIISMVLKKLSVLLLCLTLVLAAPRSMRLPEVEEKKEHVKPEEKEQVDDTIPEEVDTGLLYDNYLKQVLKVLESNSELRKKMEEASVDDIKNGKLSHAVNFLPDELRDKLNTVKKEEIHRLRRLVQAKKEDDEGQRLGGKSYLKQIANHLDHKNPHTFEADDLTNLIKAATNDLEEYDSEREDDFKNMEMEKELRRKEKLKKLNDQDRKQAEERFLKEQKEQADKHRTNHPGGRAQLEEVWNEEDGLDDQKFNPKTFFNLHDLNGDGVMDHNELEALFVKDLVKVYEDMKDTPEKHMKMDEEKRRMRKHVMSEVDKNQDHMVSLEEFMKYTGTEEFDTPHENYKTIDDLLLDHALYTSSELDKYRDEIHRQEEDIRVKLAALKAEAKQLGGMRRDLTLEKRVTMKDGITEEHEKEKLDEKEAVVKAQEEKVQTLHKQLQNQSKEVVDLKRKAKTHEASEKMIGKIMEKLDNLEHIKKAQESVDKLTSPDKAPMASPEHPAAAAESAAAIALEAAAAPDSAAVPVVNQQQQQADAVNKR